MSIYKAILWNHLGNKVPFTFAVKFIRVVTAVVGTVADFVTGNTAAVGARLEALPTASVFWEVKYKHMIGLIPQENSLTLNPNKHPRKNILIGDAIQATGKKERQKLFIYCAA